LPPALVDSSTGCHVAAPTRSFSASTSERNAVAPLFSISISATTSASIDASISTILARCRSNVGASRAPRQSLPRWRGPQPRRPSASVLK
jgi:hypothetical protein